jgi:hypothetical protein
VLKWEHKHEKAPDPFRFRPVRSNSRSSRPVPSSSQCGRCGAAIGSRGLQWQRLLKRGHERSWGDVTPTRSSGRRFNDNAVRCGQRFHSPMIAPSSGLRGLTVKHPLFDLPSRRTGSFVELHAVCCASRKIGSPDGRDGSWLCENEI